VEIIRPFDERHSRVCSLAWLAGRFSESRRVSPIRPLSSDISGAIYRVPLDNFPPLERGVERRQAGLSELSRRCATAVPRQTVRRNSSAAAGSFHHPFVRDPMLEWPSTLWSLFVSSRTKVTAVAKEPRRERTTLFHVEGLDESESECHAEAASLELPADYLSGDFLDC